MKTMDFERIVRKFHTHMCESISKLFEQYSIKELSFEKNHTAEILYEFEDGVKKLRVDAVRVETRLEVREVETGNWYPVHATSDIILCSIARVYTLTKEAIDNGCDYTTIEYDGKEYDCRMVLSTDVGISADEREPGRILIAPSSLSDAMENNDDLDCDTDQDVYYYTEDKNLSLPYGKLCECLIKEGID